MVANAAIDLVMPAPKQAAAASRPSRPKQPSRRRPIALASATSAPAEIAPREGQDHPDAVPRGALSPTPPRRPVVVPLPRPRPPRRHAASTSDRSISRQPGSMAIAAATRKAQSGRWRAARRRRHRAHEDRARADRRAGRILARDRRRTARARQGAARRTRARARRSTSTATRSSGSTGRRRR